MRRHPNHLLRNLLIASLIILAAMNPDATRQLTELATGLVLAMVQGIANAAADNPGAAAVAVITAWAVHRIHTHQPHARARH
jgi:hypothetical protein